MNVGLLGFAGRFKTTLVSLGSRLESTCGSLSCSFCLCGSFLGLPLLVREGKLYSNLLHKRELSRPFLAIVSFPRLYFLGISEVRLKGREVLKPVKAPLEVEVVDF
jgi:hypothetical protein